MQRSFFHASVSIFLFLKHFWTATQEIKWKQFFGSFQYLTEGLGAVISHQWKSIYYKSRNFSENQISPNNCSLYSSDEHL